MSLQLPPFAINTTMTLLRRFSHKPLLDGYHVNNYVETLEALPKITGLNAIRLLTLHPGAPQDPLVGTLSRHFIDDCPPYEALSYTWKAAVFTRPVEINNAEFLVTENVEKALTHLRYEDKPRTLWLDSICIDQRNVIEKNHQVRLMNRIYARSKGLVCWAGLEVEDEDDLKDGETMDIPAAFDLAREIEKTEDWEKYPEVVDRFPPVAYSTLIKLMDRSYFRRQWVIQEVCLSESVSIQVAKYLLPWSALAASAEGVAKFGRDQRASLLFPGSNRIFDLFGVRAMEFCREKTESGVFANDLIDLLRTCRGRELSDPRDMIYSLLGICGPKSMPVDVDYRKPVLVLFREVSAATITRSLDLDFLRLADHLSRDEDLPSWSPNWTHIWAGSWQIRSLKFQGWPPKEGRVVPGSDDVAFSEDLRRLTVKSVRRFVVTMVQEPSTIPEEPTNSISDAEVYAALATSLIQTEYLVTYTPRSGQTKADRRIEFVDSLFEGFTGGQSVLFTRAQFGSWYEHVVTRTTDQLSDEEKAIWCQYDAKLLKWLHEAQYFLTDGGVVGVAERVTRIQPGDAVVSLKGASEDSLFAIRQLPPAQQSDHILLNGVYIHFTPEEAEAHKAFVDDLNAGILDTQKITLV
ncbi:hypothetical protein MCOR22_009395 [Pyricularia oryzae]|nr:hypothetical protein MCOR22_009395 [Pyricularia oryzae]